MKTRIILSAAVLILTAPNIFSQKSSSRLHRPAAFDLRANTSTAAFDLRTNTFNRFDNSLSPSLLKSNILQVKPKEKSPILAAVLSGVLPGAGEFYGKSYLKAAIFFGAEALLWGGYAYFRIKGDNKTEDFQAYANTNWSIKRYGQWLKDQNFASVSGIDTNTNNLEELRRQINIAESDPRNNFSHTLPELYSQQYYEVIGKYQPYVAGWSDAIRDGTWYITKSNYQTTHTPMFDDYAVQRQDANHFYNIATTSAIIVIVNHLLSAADAAWTVSLYNKELKMQTGFNIKRYRSPFNGEFGNLPTFNLKVTF